MNCEHFIIQAGIAIATYQRNHQGSLYLETVDGHVNAKPLKGCKSFPSPSLIIRPQQQIDGLTNAQWNSIGDLLFSQHERKTQCQTHPKL